MALQKLKLRTMAFSIGEGSNGRRVVLGGLFALENVTRPGQRRTGSDESGGLTTEWFEAKLPLCEVPDVLRRMKDEHGIDAKLPDAKTVDALLARAWENVRTDGPHVKPKYPEESGFFVGFPEFPVAEPSGEITTRGIYLYFRGGIGRKQPEDKVYLVVEFPEADIDRVAALQQ